MVSAAEDICLYTTWHCIRCMDNYYSTRQSISIETSPKHNNSPSKLKRCDSGRGSKGPLSPKHNNSPSKLKRCDSGRGNKDQLWWKWPWQTRMHCTPSWLWGHCVCHNAPVEYKRTCSCHFTRAGPAEDDPPLCKWGLKPVQPVYRERTEL